MIRLLATAAAFSTAALTANAASLLVNGDFEMGNTGFTSDLTYNETQGFLVGVYDVDTNPKDWFNLFTDYRDHTSGSGKMMMVNGTNTNGTTTWSQSVNVVANTDYVFSGWLSSMTPGQTPLAIAINSVELGIGVANNTPGIWGQFSFGWNSGSATSATLAILQAPGGSNRDYALDDLSFTGPDVVVVPDPSVVPLPAALPLLLAGLGGFAALRRRKRAA